MYESCEDKTKEKESEPIYCIGCTHADMFRIKISFNKYERLFEIKFTPICCNADISNNVNHTILPIKRIPRYASCYSMNVCNKCKFFKKATLIKRIIRYFCMKYYENEIK